jgi:flagellar hook-basal body complex protein FliE
MISPLTSHSFTAAYQLVASTGGTTASGSASGFGNVLSQAISGTVHQAAATEVAATQGLTGQGDMTKVVTSVAQAQLALQTSVAIRDRLVQAYQSIINMPI